jgi:type II secretory pathway predicted ATPase ExeA
MSEFIEVGGFDDDAQHRAEQLKLPAIPTLTVTARMRDAIDTAVATRRGVAIVGPKGAGKTAALTTILAEFRARENAKWNSDRKYLRQVILRVRGLRAKTYRDGIIALFKAMTGSTLNTAARGRRKTDDELLDELVFSLMQRNIVVVAMDEVEFVSSAMFELLRDIMSESADRDPRTVDAVSDGYAAVGIAVALIGTPAITPRLIRLAELKERWARTVAVAYVDASAIAGTFVFWFPSFGKHVGTIGEKAWESFFHTKVTKGRQASLRHLDTVARFYFRRMTRKSDAHFRRETVPFSEQQFLLAWQEAQCKLGDSNSDGLSGGDDAPQA